MKHSLIVIACLASMSAWATEKPQPKPRTPIVQSQGQAQVQGQRQTQQTHVRQSSSNKAEASTGPISLQMTTQMGADKYPVSSAIPPGLAVSNGTCFGTSSAGLTVAAASIAGGGPVLDKGCDARYDFYALLAQGDEASANARLCMKEEIREAKRVAGTPCPEGPEREVIEPQHTDPFVRQRLGLPPM